MDDSQLASGLLGANILEYHLLFLYFVCACVFACVCSTLSTHFWQRMSSASVTNLPTTS